MRGEAIVAKRTHPGCGALEHGNGFARVTILSMCIDEPFHAASPNGQSSLKTYIIKSHTERVC